MGLINDEDVDVYTETKTTEGRWKTGFNCVSRHGIIKYFESMSMDVDFHPIAIPSSFLKSIDSNSDLRILYGKNKEPLLCTKSGLILNPVLIAAKMKVS